MCQLQCVMNKSPQMLANPNMTNSSFIILFLGWLSSWGRTSKKVMYRNVPPAMPWSTELAMSPFKVLFMSAKAIPKPMPIGDATAKMKPDTRYRLTLMLDWAKVSPRPASFPARAMCRVSTM